MQYDTALYGYSTSNPQAAQIRLHFVASVLENPCTTKPNDQLSSSRPVVFKCKCTAGWPVSAAHALGSLPRHATAFFSPSMPHSSRYVSSSPAVSYLFKA